MTFPKTSYSFVVRIWLEPREISETPVEWRGVIEEVMSGHRRYFIDLEQIINFIIQETDQNKKEDKFGSDDIWPITGQSRLSGKVS